MLVGSSSNETGRQMGKKNSVFCSLPNVEKQMDWLQHARFVKVYLIGLGKENSNKISGKVYQTKGTYICFGLI